MDQLTYSPLMQNWLGVCVYYGTYAILKKYYSMSNI